MELTQYLAALRRRWWWLALGVLIALSGIIVYDHRITPVYQSSSRLLVTQAASPGPSASTSAQTSQQLAKTYSELIKSRPVLSATIARLNLPTTPESLSMRTQVSIVPDTPIIQVVVSDTDPKRASLIVDDLVHTFAQNIQGDQQTSDRRASLQSSLNEVNSNITRVQGKITDTSNALSQLRSSLDAYAATSSEIQQLVDQLAKDRQSSLQIRQQRADLTNRVFQMRSQPSNTSEAEIQSLSAEIKRYDTDLNDTDQRITAAASRLDTLRSLPRPSGTTADAQRLQDELNQYQEQYRKLSDTQQSILLSNDTYAPSISVTEPANIPTQPIRPRVTQDILLAGFLGLLLAVGLVVTRTYFDDRLQDSEAFRRRFNITPLGTLDVVRHRRARILSHNASHNVPIPGDTLRLLRANLAAEIRHTPFVMCVTSANDGEGKSTIAANLAILEAQMGSRVILADANLRSPRLHRTFGLANDRGMSTLLADPACNVEAELQEGPQGIAVLTSGPVPPDPAAMLSSPRMVALIADLRAHADIIIFDTASVLSVPDTLLFHEHTDGVVLVIDTQRTGTKTLERLFATLESASVRLLGVVLNKNTRYARGIGSHRPSLIDTPSHPRESLIQRLPPSSDATDGAPTKTHVTATHE